MAKVLILVEGQTEETFVKRVLNPHLSQFGILAIPTIVATKRVKSGSDFKGGVPSYNKVKKEIRYLLRDSSAQLVTTMLDYYGLPRSFPGRDAVRGRTADERVLYVEQALKEDIRDGRFVPYYALHEFEALLFVSPQKIAEAFSESGKEAELEAIVSEFDSPEEINDDPETAP